MIFKNNFGDNLIFDLTGEKNNKLIVNQDISLWRFKYKFIKERHLPSQIKKYNWIQIIEVNLFLRSKQVNSDIYLA